MPNNLRPPLEVFAEGRCGDKTPTVPDALVSSATTHDRMFRPPQG